MEINWNVITFSQEFNSHRSSPTNQNKKRKSKKSKVSIKEMNTIVTSLNLFFISNVFHKWNWFKISKSSREDKSWK